LSAQGLRRACRTDARAAICLKCALIRAIRVYRRLWGLLRRNWQQRPSEGRPKVLGVNKRGIHRDEGEQQSADSTSIAADSTSIAHVQLPTAPEIAPGVSETGDIVGPLGGGQVGCNYQFAPNWVIGIEGDAAAADIKGDATSTVLGVTGTAHARTDWIASATGRFGWAWDRWLLYAKGGAAWAGDKYSADIPVFPEHLEASETRAGWTVGGGLEWAFWYNWSAKVEYDFYDFGTRTLTLSGTFAGVPEVVPGVDIKQRVSVAKFGINYRFGSW
jgi:opacity protein-like surface antigen